MKIAEALKKRKKFLKKPYLGSVKLGMHNQSPKTLAYWLLMDGESENNTKIKLLKDMLEADDWELEEK